MFIKVLNLLHGQNNEDFKTVCLQYFFYLTLFPIIYICYIYIVAQIHQSKFPVCVNLFGNKTRF